jgi:phospholipase/carboxylesterase
MRTVDEDMLESELIRARDGSSGRLMVMLHGLGDSMEGYRWLPDALNLPWLNYLLVNAPDDYYGGFSWYDFAGDARSGVIRSRGLLFQVLDAQVREGFPASQITLGGFSQGCLMSLDVGLRYRERLAGIVGISGYVSEPENLVIELSPVARQQRLLVTHGTLDPMIPISMPRGQMKLLQQAGVNLSWNEFPKVHTISDEGELDLIRSFVEAGYAG